MSIRGGRLAAVAAGASALLSFAPEEPFRLSVEPGVLADDTCLAPSDGRSDCAALMANGPNDSRATASAALLPWEMPRPEPAPLLAFDNAVLEASAELTFSCAPGECRPRRQILTAAGAAAGAD